MYTCNMHYSGIAAKDVKDIIVEAIRFAKREKDKILCLIVGYGSSGKTHKIKTTSLKYLDELMKLNKINNYIVGNELDLFNEKYLSISRAYYIPDSEKKEKNPGKIYVFV